MKRYVLSLLIALPILLVAVPTTLVMYHAKDAHHLQPRENAQPTTIDEKNQIPIKLYRTKQKKVDTIPLELYIEGVVAAEMPAEFELEALKAQALAARTYIIRRIGEGKFGDVPQDAQVVDTVKHQAFLDEQERKARWGNAFSWKQERIKQAVRETAGVVLTYQGKPIDATFFSTSNGFTENADEYWQESIPYLRSVASPWDAQSPRYAEEVSIPMPEFQQKLGVTLTAQASDGAWYQVLERTTGSRIGRIRISNRDFTGKEVRERLGLNSSAFSLRLSDGYVKIATRGYGHGVGMSQWGANGMAKAGKNAEQIVKYFYQGISLQTYTQVL